MEDSKYIVDLIAGIAHTHRNFLALYNAAFGHGTGRRRPGEQLDS